MNQDLVLTISLVILVLPLVGFVIQLLLGKMRVPADYVIDPHENPHHDHGHHDNPADAATADHTQHAVDVPHDAAHAVHATDDAHAGHGAHDTGHGAHDVHYDYTVTDTRGPWTERDQNRAYRLSWIST